MRRIGLIALFCWDCAAAADYLVGVENYQHPLSRLQPGDRLLLRPGDYPGGLVLRGISGTPGHPVVIEAADAARPPRFTAQKGANTLSLANVRHLVVRNLELDGRNLPVDAVKAEGHSRYADFVTLEKLFIHDYAGSQQSVGISTKCPAFGWVLRDNRIERVGTGMYFGDSDGSDAFVGAVIEGNRISRTLGYNLQIKHQKSRPRAYPDRAETVIRYNVFSKAAGAGARALARPNVLLGHFPVDGPGSEDRYRVHGNLFLHNRDEALLQAEGRLAVYDNIFINGSGDALRIQPHHDIPREMAIFANTVVASGVGIRVRSAPGAPYRQRVIANVVAAAAPLEGGDAAHNALRPYRHELVAIPVAELTHRLLAGGALPSRLPRRVAQELAAYPDRAGAGGAGAAVAPALQRSLHAFQQ
jgi:hypothetical protein